MSLIRTKVTPIDENESKVVMEISFVINKNHLGDVYHDIDMMLMRFAL